MSDKKIAIIIIVLAGLGGLGYWLFAWGTVEIFVANEGVGQFELETRQGIQRCENPCRVQLRPGKQLLGEVSALDFRAEPVKSERASFLSKQKIALLLNPILDLERIPIEDFVAQEMVRQEPFEQYAQQAIGPVRVNESGTRAAFLRSLKNGETELVLVDTKDQVQRLAIFEDVFLPAILEKNFQFFSQGILVPSAQKLYEYDFTRNQKRVLLEGKMFYIANVSQNGNGNVVLKSEKGWKTISLDGKENLLNENVLWAQYSADSLWILAGRQIERDGIVVAELPEIPEKNDEIWFDFSEGVNTLWIRRDLEVWKVDLGR